jgi:hypothetical protein
MPAEILVESSPGRPIPTVAIFHAVFVGWPQWWLGQFRIAPTKCRPVTETMRALPYNRAIHLNSTSLCTHRVDATWFGVYSRVRTPGFRTESKLYQQGQLSCRVHVGAFKPHSRRFLDFPSLCLLWYCSFALLVEESQGCLWWTQAMTCLSELPDSLIWLILSFLDARDLARCSSARAVPGSHLHTPQSISNLPCCRAEEKDAAELIG